MKIVRLGQRRRYKKKKNISRQFIGSISADLVNFKLITVKFINELNIFNKTFK